MKRHRRYFAPTYSRDSPAGVCRWCGGAMLRPDGTPQRLRWHPECVQAFKIANWPAAQRKCCWERDHGVCCACGLDTKEGWTPQGWSGRMSPGWQADHCRPLFESNGDAAYYAADNLRTLCRACHRAKGAAEAGRRAAKRRPEKLQQMDFPMNK